MLGGYSSLSPIPWTARQSVELRRQVSNGPRVYDFNRCHADADQYLPCLISDYNALAMLHTVKTQGDSNSLNGDPFKVLCVSNKYWSDLVSPLWKSDLGVPTVRVRRRID